ncbi:MAG: hypothetical protein AB1668_03870 [Nanoarchaeota archaeon]
MKRAVAVLGFSALILLLFSLLARAAEQPPSLLSHQFYGQVTWGSADITPTEVLVKVGDKKYTSKIESSPCSGDICTGKYGYDPENLLRVQGKVNDKVLFFINNVKVKEYLYQDGAVTELELSLAAGEEAAPQEPEEEVVKEVVKEPAVAEPAELPAEPAAEEPAEAAPEEYVAEEPEPPAAEQEAYVYVPPTPTPKEEVSEEAAVEEKSFLSSKMYFILGGMLVLLAVAVAIMFLLKRSRGRAVQAESPQEYQQ